MTTVHLIYPHRPRISAPDTIGRHLGQALSARYDVAYYDWDEARTLQPERGDVLLGHPHPAPWSIFRRSARSPGWRRVLALSPYTHGDNYQVAFIDSILADCDLYLAITGNYWFNTVGTSPFAHWLPKMRHVDLAIDRQDYPVLKREFNPAGQRRFVYVGHAGRKPNLRYKNTEYLSAIARAVPEAYFGWIGLPTESLPGLAALGYQNFDTPAGQQLAASFDYLITVGRADANPTTILEAMAWGLVPVCTPQSGYVGYPGIINLPLDDIPGAVSLLRQLQNVPAAELAQHQTNNWRALEEHFNWERFAAQVIDAIESDDSPPLGPVIARQRAYLRWCAAVSPLSPWHPLNLARLVARRLRRRSVLSGARD